MNIFGKDVKINAKNVFGHSLVIQNNKVIIDGIDVTPDAKNITVEIKGNVETVDIESCAILKIEGDTGAIKVGSGDITIRGSAKAMLALILETSNAETS